VNDCTIRHHRLLHHDSRQESNTPCHGGGLRVSEQRAAAASQQEEQAADETPRMSLRTVPAMIESHGRSLRVNALLDDASTCSYMSSEAAAKLGLKGKRRPMRVRTVNDEESDFVSARVEFRVSSCDGEFSRTVAANTIESVTGGMRAVDWSCAAAQWQHLGHLPFLERQGNGRVDLLIGADFADMHVSRREAVGTAAEPTARLTPLGWTCVGRVDESES
jgi:hypothetical protein